MPARVRESATNSLGFALIFASLVTSGCGRHNTPYDAAVLNAAIPLPAPRPAADAPAVLALGGDLKAAPALALGSQVWMAAHQGDLADARSLRRWQAGLMDLRRRLPSPLQLVCDGHPGYLSLLAEFDRVLAISRASADELREFWEWQGRAPRASVTALTLGADFNRRPRTTSVVRPEPVEGRADRW